MRQKTPKKEQTFTPMVAGDFVELDPLKNAQNSITHAPPLGLTQPTL
jgi:hypothetical protein